MQTRRHLIALAAALLLGVAAASAQDKSIVVSSTTSTQDSGLFGHILPMFKAKTGIDVKVVSQGTGQALDTGRRGDADVVFVHAKPQEEKFVAEGFGVKRYPVMYNDFILVGPKSDPAGVKGKDIVAALQGDQGQERAVHLARRQVAARTRPSSRSGRPPASTSPARTRAPGTRRSARAWARRSTPRRRRTPMCCRPRHLAVVQEPRRSRHPRRGRQAAVQPVRRHAGEPGEARAREEGARPGLHRLAGLGRGPEGDRRLQDQRRSSCSSRTPPCRARDAHAFVQRSRSGGSVMIAHGACRRHGPAPRRRQPARRADRGEQGASRPRPAARCRPSSARRAC